MAVQAAKRLFSVHDFHKMAAAGIFMPEDRIELINGEILTRSPINSRHSGHLIRLQKVLEALLGDRVLISAQNPLRLDAFSEPQPDLAILKPNTHFYTEHHPGPADVFWLIEISDSTLHYDRYTKLPLYAASGIPETWIIDLNKKRLECYSRPDTASGKYLDQKIITRQERVVLAGFDLDLEVGKIL